MGISPEEARQRGIEPVEITRIETAEAGRSEAEQLCQMIDEVFVEIPAPPVTLRVARALDDEWEITPERANELASGDTQADWRDVSEEDTRCYQEYFNFADAPGWRFYLPAFMTHYLRGFPDYSWDAVYWACSRRTHFGLLTENEIAVVDRFLSLCHKYEPDH